jgi:ATP-dependent RNA helicase DeaD
MAELFVSIGRRDGIRAQDLLKTLADAAGLDPATVQRIRVRERHSFVSIKKSDVEKTLEKVEGVSLGGRALHVEIARERPAESGEQR